MLFYFIVCNCFLLFILLSFYCLFSLALLLTFLLYSFLLFKCIFSLLTFSACYGMFLYFYRLFSWVLLFILICYINHIYPLMFLCFVTLCCLYSSLCSIYIHLSCAKVATYYMYGEQFIRVYRYKENQEFIPQQVFISHSTLYHIVLSLKTNVEWCISCLQDEML